MQAVCDGLPKFQGPPRIDSGFVHIEHLLSRAEVGLPNIKNPTRGMSAFASIVYTGPKGPVVNESTTVPPTTITRAATSDAPGAGGTPIAQTTTTGDRASVEPAGESGKDGAAGGTASLVAGGAFAGAGLVAIIVCVWFMVGKRRRCEPNEKSGTGSDGGVSVVRRALRPPLPLGEGPVYETVDRSHGVPGSGVADPQQHQASLNYFPGDIGVEGGVFYDTVLPSDGHDVGDGSELGGFSTTSFRVPSEAAPNGEGPPGARPLYDNVQEVGGALKFDGGGDDFDVGGAGSDGSDGEFGVGGDESDIQGFAV